MVYWPTLRRPSNWSSSLRHRGELVLRRTTIAILWKSSRNLEYVGVNGVLFGIVYQVNAILPYSLFFDEVLDIKRVKTDFNALLDQGILSVLLEKVHLLVRVDLTLQRKLLRDPLAVCIFSRLGENILRHEEVDKLAWNLLKGFFCKFVRVVSEFTEWYELNNVSRHILLVLHGVERLVICIKSVHAVKVSVTNSNNYN